MFHVWRKRYSIISCRYHKKFWQRRFSSLRMAYSGFAVVVMLGIGLGALLCYVFSEPEQTQSHTHQTSNNNSIHWSSHTSNSRRHSSNECTICLYKMDESNTIRLRPCGHYFHQDCIMSWKTLGPLISRDSCPLCRNFIATATT